MEACSLGRDECRRKVLFGGTTALYGDSRRGVRVRGAPGTFASLSPASLRPGANSSASHNQTCA